MSPRIRPIPPILSIPVQLLKYAARPCLPASIIACFAAIVCWYTAAVARSEGDAVAAEVLSYVTFWLGALAAILFVFVALVVLIGVVNDRAQTLAARKGWGWT